MSVVQVLNESLETFQSVGFIHDGRTLADKFLRQTFRDDSGISMHIDQNGERRTDLMVVHFNESGERQVSLWVYWFALVCWSSSGLGSAGSCAATVSR